MKIILIVFLISLNSAFAQRDVSISIQIEQEDSITNDYQIDVFKLYISSVSVQFEDSTAHYEDNSYHLIDLMDSDSKSFILSQILDKQITQIQFTIGTDSLANVSGAMDGDLDPILGMYWAWNSGYINFKLEGKKGDQSFEYHIGGYNGNQATAKRFKYPVNNDVNIKIILDPIAFLNQVDISSMHSVLIPGNEAVQLTENYQNMIRIE